LKITESVRKTGSRGEEKKRKKESRSEERRRRGRRGIRKSADVMHSFGTFHPIDFLNQIQRNG
jgi:hypothetical protein